MSFFADGFQVSMSCAGILVESEKVVLTPKMFPDRGQHIEDGLLTRAQMKRISFYTWLIGNIARNAFKPIDFQSSGGRISQTPLSNGGHT